MTGVKGRARNAHAQVGRFVIVATPRSGSNWLCTLLDSHPAILCHHELFNPNGVHLARSLQGTGFDLGGPALQRNNPLGLIEQAWTQSSGYSHVGFKLNIGQSEAAFTAILTDDLVQKLVVTRLNRVRAYVSELIAEKSGQWESYPESRQPQKVGPVRVDPGALKAHARRNTAHLNSIRQRLSSRGALFKEVHYESIGQAQTQREILDFLGADPNVILKGMTRRMNPEPLCELVSNFDELTAALGGDGWAADLEMAGHE